MTTETNEPLVVGESISGQLTRPCTLAELESAILERLSVRKVYVLVPQQDGYYLKLIGNLAVTLTAADHPPQRTTVLTSPPPLDEVNHSQEPGPSSSGEAEGPTEHPEAKLQPIRPRRKRRSKN